MSRKIKVAPSILAADFRYLEREVKSVEDAGADSIHCDIMDGVYVPNISFGPQVVAAVKKSVSIPLDVHLMIVQPEKYIHQFVDAGADNLTVHADACKDIEAVVDVIHKAGITAGITVNPDKSIQLFTNHLEKLDMVLIMSVYAGFGGQPFMFETLEKVRKLVALRKEQGLQFAIEIDGGINAETSKECIKNGVDVLVSGSYIFNSKNHASSINVLRES